MLITGASRGIGATTAVLAASRGWDLGVTYQTQEAAAKAIVVTCQAAGARAVGVQCELADASSVLAAYKPCDSELGQLSCLINNAGVLFEMSRLENMDDDRVSTPTCAPTLACPTAPKIASQRAYVARRSRRRSCVADPALASDEASYVTGTNIDIAGGR